MAAQFPNPHPFPPFVAAVFFILIFIAATA